MNIGKYVSISSIVVGDVISLNGVLSLVLSNRPPSGGSAHWNVRVFRQNCATVWYITGAKAEVWKCFT
jgi:hypothetical protein